MAEQTGTKAEVQIPEVVTMGDIIDLHQLVHQCVVLGVHMEDGPMVQLVDPEPKLEAEVVDAPMVHLDQGDVEEEVPHKLNKLTTEHVEEDQIQKMKGGEMGEDMVMAILKDQEGILHHMAKRNKYEKLVKI
eukprot:TRINITY_DN14624_c0_g1_i10.p1 TRINITY_DN14624_c0_g1~~TRINITY_DN14624_c0_g1_i10.p1  ORF type:complete len:148 (-),score=42.86 TRINITY_DN14624_c0_g1_i10:32-427(-)